MFIFTFHAKSTEHAQNLTVEIMFASTAPVFDRLMVLDTLNIFGMINVHSATSAVFLFSYPLNVVTCCLDQLSLLLNHSKQRKMWRIGPFTVFIGWTLLSTFNNQAALVGINLQGKGLVPFPCQAVL